jgi:arsenite-transporting ATPase
VRLVLYTGKGRSARRRRRPRLRSSRPSAGCARWSRRPTSRTASATCSDARLGPSRAARAGLHALEIDPRVESARHWGRIQRFLERTFRHQGIEAAVAEELAMLPGAEELTTLLAVSSSPRARLRSCSCSTARPPTRRCGS